MEWDVQEMHMGKSFFRFMNLNKTLLFKCYISLKIMNNYGMTS